MKLEKLSSHRNLDNVEKESYKRNWVDMSDDNKSAEGYEIIKNDEEKFLDVDEEYDKIDHIEESKEDDLE